MAYGKINKADKMICINSIDKKLLYQLLKNGSVVLLDKHKNANGDAKIRILIIIYLTEKLVRRANEENESILDKIPLREKILKF